MNDFPRQLVIDASVGIQLFLPEQYSQIVDDLFTSARADPQRALLAPDLFFIECGNVLWKRVRQGQCSIAMARGSMVDLVALELVSTPTVDLAERAVEIACLCGIAAYDACYVALSESADAPLITADVRLRDRIAKQFDVLLLGE